MIRSIKEHAPRGEWLEVLAVTSHLLTREASRLIPLLNNVMSNVPPTEFIANVIGMNAVHRESVMVAIPLVW